MVYWVLNTTPIQIEKAHNELLATEQHGICGRNNYTLPFPRSFTPCRTSPKRFMYRKYGIPVLHDCKDAGGRATQELKPRSKKPVLICRKTLHLNLSPFPEINIYKTTSSATNSLDPRSPAPDPRFSAVGKLYTFLTTG